MAPTATPSAATTPTSTFLAGVAAGAAAAGGASRVEAREVVTWAWVEEERAGLEDGLVAAGVEVAEVDEVVEELVEVAVVVGEAVDIGDRGSFGFEGFVLGQ